MAIARDRPIGIESYQHEWQTGEDPLPQPAFYRLFGSVFRNQNQRLRAARARRRNDRHQAGAGGRYA